MKTIGLKLQRQISNVHIINNNMQRFLLHIIFWSFTALALWYVFLLGSMVWNIVERRSLEKSASMLSSEVGELELTYLSLSNDIDLAFSHSLGFTETKAKFATRKTLGSLKIAN